MFWTKEGKSLPVRYVTTPIKENNRISGCVVLFRDITERRRAEASLRESEQNLRYLATQLIDAQERERERISRELHDELGQALLVLKLQAGDIEEQINRNPTGAGAECREMSANLDQLVENVRRLSRDLSPAILQDLGLTAALRHLVNEFAKRHNLQPNLDLPPDLDGFFPREAQINIYRIFQESLTNIGKYAQASSLTMAVTQKNGRIVFRLADDGQGFEVDKVMARESTRRGLGLAAMEERGRMLGGKVDINYILLEPASRGLNQGNHALLYSNPVDFAAIPGRRPGLETDRRHRSLQDLGSHSRSHLSHGPETLPGVI